MIPEPIKEIVDILKDIGAFTGLAVLGKWFFGLYANRLSRREKEILVAAFHGDNSINWIKVPGMGQSWIRAGGIDLGKDGTSQAEFVDALERLVGRGLVRCFSDSMFQLSGSGIKLAEKLAQTIDVRSIQPEQTPTA